MRVVAWPARAHRKRNPFQALLYDAVENTCDVEIIEFGLKNWISAADADILHIHWPDAFLAAGEGWRFWPRLLFLRLICTMARLRGTRVVWTAHNLKRAGQRNGDRLDRWFWPWFQSAVDGVIYMTKASLWQAERTLPGLLKNPYEVIPHGDYLEQIAAVAPDDHPNRETLPTAIFFGTISRYKNVYTIVNAYAELEPRTAQLWICGEISRTEPDNDLMGCLASLPSEYRENIFVEDMFLPDASLAQRVRQADLVVLPYTDVLNSGAAIYALSAGRPVLCTNSDLFRELQNLVGADWFHLFDPPLTGAAFRDALVAARRLHEIGAAPDVSAFAWDRIARQTVDFYRRL